MAIESSVHRSIVVNESNPPGDNWTPAQKAALAEAAKAAGLNPEILLSIGPPGRGKSAPAPSAKPPYDGDLSPTEVDCLMPFLVTEMRTRGKVSAVDCLNSLIWLKRHNCYWTRTPEDRYGNREHRRKLIERWAREVRFDRLADWVQATPLSDDRKKELLAICSAQANRGRRLRALQATPHGSR
jgi:hypothetical protein